MKKLITAAELKTTKNGRENSSKSLDDLVISFINKELLKRKKQGGSSLCIGRIDIGGCLLEELQKRLIKAGYETCISNEGISLTIRWWKY